MKRHYKAGVSRGRLAMVSDWLRPLHRRVLLAGAVVAILITQIIPCFQPQISAQRYSLEDANQLLPQTSSELAKALRYDIKSKNYQFNADYTPGSSNLVNGGSTGQGGSKIKATAASLASDGVTVTDPVNNVDFTLKPQFALMTAKQDSNRVYYPLEDGSGWLVYSMLGGQVAEDLVLTHAVNDHLDFKYTLGLDNGLAARKLADGSIGIYGSSLPINGQVSTGSDKDAALLAKLRSSASKDKLLFTLPPPVIRQTGLNTPDVNASYVLNGDQLTLRVNGLKQGHYPLDIDPSVYVQSAQGLMYGNNESSITFDTTNDLFEKTPVSGGNIRNGVSQASWVGTTSLPTGLWGFSTVISGGFIYVVGGTTGSLGSPSASVYWAQLNLSSSTLIGNWTTNTGYDLPVALRHLSLVAYNDYLYAIGGNSGSAVVDTVYKLHLAASGEPTPAWVSAGNNLPAGAGRQYSAAVAYQNQLYVTGGQTAATGTTGSNTVYTASVKADGTIGSWSALGTLPAAVWGHSMATYNGYLYVVGGAVGTGMQTAIYYAQINSPGAIGSWQTNANTFTTGRSSQGGNFMTIWAGYMYVSGGCNAVNGSGYCTTTPQGDVQEASINADGSISAWTALQSYNTGTSAFAPISQPRLGYGLVAFGTAFASSAANAGGTLYAVGGCNAAQNTTTGACSSPLTTATYAAISSEGDIGPAQTTTALPTAAGAFAAGVAVNNGYLYDVGGCAYQASGTNACGTTVNKIYYAQISASGTLGSWTATTATLSVSAAAVGVTTINNYLYVVGGSSGSAAIRNIAYGAFASNGDIATMAAGSNLMPTGYLYPYAFSYVNATLPAQGYLYYAGGCTTTSGIGCSSGTYSDDVYRCTISAAGVPSGCVTTGQLPLPTGTGIAAGATYGTYVYLSSGANSGTSGTAGSWGGQTNLTYYAKIDSSGNVVLPPNKTGAVWPTTTGKLANNGVTDAGTDNAPGQRRRAAGFAVNGFLYVLGGHDANADTGNGDTLQDMEIGKIDPTTGDIASFTDNYYQITPRWDFKGVAANGFIYAVGGCSTGAPPGSCTAQDRAVQYMQVYNNYSGTPASYGTTTANTTARIGSSSAIYNGYIYNAGGCTAIDCSTLTNSVEYAPIDANSGAIGTWTTAPSTMVSSRTGFKLLANNGYLYALGGYTAANSTTATSSTEVAAITGGVPQSWSATTSMNVVRANFDAVIYNGYIYASGGINGAGNPVATLEYSKIGTPALGSWTTNSNNFTVARSGHMSVAYNGTLYIIGGVNAANNYYGDVQYAQINSNGSVGTFSSTQRLPQAVRQGSAFAANGYLYVVGGRSADGTCTSNTYVASIMANSTVASGNVPNGLGGWSQTAVNFSGARYGAAVSYNAGKVYVMGGGCTAFTNTAYYATLQSQPQIAQYSYYVDAINDVFPSKSLFNGIDNGIGASWVLDYRSSTNANISWGNSTSYGKTTLGTPQTYTPIDGSGTNTNFARYYWVQLTIDGSQAFGYPEDVSRGPTIANLTLQFTANPAQRLRHGKTFINNVQQPLDAPF